MIHIRREVSLLPYNTFGIASTASEFIESDDSVELSDYFSDLPEPFSGLILGGGSNILFVSDRCNTIIRPVFKGIELMDETDENVLVRAKAGEIWDDFVDWCVKRDYAGVENLSHIPGTVGAGPIQNIGAYGAEIKNVVENVEAMEIASGKTILFDNRQCQFDYRNSFFKQNKGAYLVTAVWFRLTKNFVPNIKYTDLKTELLHIPQITIDSVRRSVIAIRGRKLPDPAEIGNAGSFFKNPTIDIKRAEEISQSNPQAPLYPISSEHCKISAAWLIQQCGLKGIRTGSVGTHPNQPLVIVNYGGATGKEVLDLAERIISSVYEKFGIFLESEVNIAR